MRKKYVLRNKRAWRVYASRLRTLEFLCGRLVIVVVIVVIEAGLAVGGGDALNETVSDPVFNQVTGSDQTQYEE